MFAAVAVSILLCIGNLILTLGVVRRLNDHSTVLDALAGQAPPGMLPAGTPITPFAATTVDGQDLTRDGLLPPTLVGFLSTTCAPCYERLPDFVDRARRAPAGRAIAVVVDTGGVRRDEMVARLRGSALVVIEPPGGPLATAFGVEAFPAFAVVGADGVLDASAADLRSIPVLVGI